jgi:Tir chaperone protein (CesT) family
VATLEDLLAGLGERTGLAGLEPDEEGLYTFVIGGTLPVFLRPAEDAVLLYAGIGTLPAARADAACRRLLEANHLWLQAGGLSLGLLPGTSSVLLVARERLEGLDPAGFFALFDRFVEAAVAWRERLPELADEGQGDAERSLTGEVPPGGELEPSDGRAEHHPGPGDFA